MQFEVRLIRQDAFSGRNEQRIGLKENLRDCEIERGKVMTCVRKDLVKDERSEK